MAHQLLALLHLCDSLFPIGAFGYSEGLETATASGAISGPASLGGWMAVCLDETIGRVEGPAMGAAWAAFHARAWATLLRLDREVRALRPSSAARRSSRAMGLRMLSTWQALHPDASLAEMLGLAHAGALGPTLPVAFGTVCASAAVERRWAAEAFAYTRLAATVAAAMRLMPIGQAEAHRLLAGALARVPEVVDAMLAREGAPESFAPAMDIATMTQQYLNSRLFRS